MLCPRISSILILGADTSAASNKPENSNRNSYYADTNKYKNPWKKEINLTYIMFIKRLKYASWNGKQAAKKWLHMTDACLLHVFLTYFTFYGLLISMLLKNVKKGKKTGDPYGTFDCLMVRTIVWYETLSTLP